MERRIEKNRKFRIVIFAFIFILCVGMGAYFVFIDKEKSLKKPVVRISYNSFLDKSLQFQYDVSIPEKLYINDESKLGTEKASYIIDGWKIYKLDSNGEKEYKGSRYSLVKDNNLVSSYNGTINLGEEEKYLAIAYKKRIESEPFEFTISGKLDIMPIKFSITNGTYENNNYTCDLSYNLKKRDDEYYVELNDEYNKALVTTNNLNLQKYIIWEKYVYDSIGDVQLPYGNYKLVKQMNTIETEKINRYGNFVYRYYVKKSNGEKVYSDYYDITISESNTPVLSCTLVGKREVNGINYYKYRFRIENPEAYQLDNKTNNIMYYDWQLSRAQNIKDSEVINFNPIHDEIKINDDYYDEVAFNENYIYNAKVMFTLVNTEKKQTIGRVSFGSNDCYIGINNNENEINVTS